MVEWKVVFVCFLFAYMFLGLTVGVRFMIPLEKLTIRCFVKLFNCDILILCKNTCMLILPPFLRI